VGCCSLRVEHIKFEGDSQITLEFLGKDSIEYKNTVKVDPLVYENLERFTKGKQPDNDLFEKINASALNDYLKELMEGLSAKVFRTYNASITLQRELTNEDVNPDADVKAKLESYEKCNRQVAILCNHQKAVNKNHAQQMEKIQEKMKQKTEQLESLKAALKKLKAGKEPSEKGMPKTVDQCKKQIEKVQK